MREFPPAFFAVIRAIDRFTDATGKLVSLAMLYLLVALSSEAFSRYVLNAPTNWAPETAIMANGAAFMLGCGYALLKRAHVRTDVFWNRYSGRRKGAIDLFSYLLLFFPAMLALVWIGIDDVRYSYAIGEVSPLTPWGALLWPFRAALPLAALLLAVQGVSETLKSWYAVRTGREYEQRGGAGL
jgi:TRAP-type mannitol/chloroaromatic compound transport system permease small subunit